MRVQGLLDKEAVRFEGQKEVELIESDLGVWSSVPQESRLEIQQIQEQSLIQTRVSQFSVRKTPEYIHIPQCAVAE